MRLNIEPDHAISSRQRRIAVVRVAAFGVGVVERTAITGEIASHNFHTGEATRPEHGDAMVGCHFCKTPRRFAGSGSFSGDHSQGFEYPYGLSRSNDAFAKSSTRRRHERRELAGHPRSARRTPSSLISRGVGNRSDNNSENSFPRPIDLYTPRRIVWIAFSRRRKSLKPPRLGPTADLWDCIPFDRQTPRGWLRK
jgi:hypothetical protein